MRRLLKRPRGAPVGPDSSSPSKTGPTRSSSVNLSCVSLRVTGTMARVSVICNACTEIPPSPSIMVDVLYILKKLQLSRFISKPIE